jgi:hypothetical protein
VFCNRVEQQREHLHRKLKGQQLKTACVAISNKTKQNKTKQNKTTNQPTEQTNKPETKKQQGLNRRTVVTKISVVDTPVPVRQVRKKDSPEVTRCCG